MCFFFLFLNLYFDFSFTFEFYLQLRIFKDRVLDPYFSMYISNCMCLSMNNTF